MEEKLHQTKPLDDQKERESELQRKNEEDQAIIQDKNASPSHKEAAEGRVAERNEELARLQTQIAEREKARHLLERIKEIFKKYGVTVTAILLAAGGHNRGCRQFNHKCFESHRQIFGERPKRYWRETWFSATRADWINCEFSFQSCGPSHRVSGQAHLAAYSCRGGLLFEKYVKKRR